ncbi:MAG TPA: hypothetical protein GX707_03740 [Epulopiscium sp.]|nr:hypothetical protein [Candidatus Epulonipiscium sp.]
MEPEQNKPVPTETGSYTNEDIEKNKTVAGLAYLLFFLPLIACPESEFGKFHANQALLLWIAGAASNAVLRYIPIIGGTVSMLLSIAILVFGIMGLIGAFGGKAEELPLIGQYRIIK